MITVRNLQRRQKVALEPLQAFGARALRRCLKLRRAQPTALTTLPAIDVLLISDRRMAALHQQFRHIAGPTDVLTFEHGEIVISVDTARANARRFHTSTVHELRLYLVHGLLHLHGYDDLQPRQRQRMQVVQERILRAAGGEDTGGGSGLK